MAVDPNVYALSIQLALDTSDAFSSLDEFGTKAADIEQTISQAAQNSINAISGMIDSMNSNLLQSVAVMGEFATASSKINLDLAAALKTTTKTKAIDDGNFEQLEKKLKHLEEIDKLQEDMQKALEAEQVVGKDYLNLLGQWVSTLEHKNDLHREETGLVEAESDIISQIGKKWQGVKKDNLELKDIYDAVRRVVYKTWSYIKLYAEETEKFITANYRAYGSQQELANSARYVAARYGIMRDKAFEAYAALGNVKAPRDEIEKLAKSIAGASRYTGVGIEQLAQYSFKMRQIRFDADKMEKQLRFVAEAMRKFGLSTSDVNKILTSTGLSASSLETIFKGEDQSAKYDKLRLSIAGLAKQMGFASEVSESFFKNLEDPMKRALFEDYAGQTISSVEEMQSAIAKAGKRARADLDAISDAIEAGALTSQDAQIEMKVLADTYGFGSVEAMQMAASLNKVAEEMGLNLENAQDFEKAMQKLIEQGTDPLSEANNTLTAQLGLLRSSLGSVAGAILQLVADAILPFVKALNYVISGIVEVVGLIGSAIAFLEKWVPGFKLVTATIRYLGGAIVGLGLAAISAVSAITSFAYAFGRASTMISRAVDIVTSVIRSILSLASNIATAIQTILAGIGRGFAALGAAVAPVAIPLMQVGAAAMMVGAAFLFMGLGLYFAADSGWQAVAMLAALSAVMVIMVSVLALISTVVAPVIPVMYALAGVMVVLGVAVALVGASLYMIGLSLEAFSTHGAKAAAVMPDIILALAGLGVAGLASSFGIAALGAALTLLLVPIKLFGNSMDKLNSVIDSFKSLLSSSKEMKAAFLDLIDVGRLFFYTVMEMISVFALISVVVSPAIVAMFALSAVMLILGAAVFVAGYGIRAIGEAVELFATHGANAIAIMPALAAAILTLAAAGTAGSLGIAALGISLGLLAAPLKVIGTSVSQLTAAIDYIKNLSSYIDTLRSNIIQMSDIGLTLMAVVSQMVLVFAMLSVVVAPALPFILALSAVMLMLGAAVMMAGRGLNLISVSLESFAVHGLNAAAAMPAIAAGMMQLAIVGLFGSFGITALGLALMVLSVPLKSITESMTKLSEAMKSLSIENLNPIASGLYEASVYFIRAGVNFGIAGPLLISGIISISAAAIMLGFAAPLLTYFGAMYLFASELLLYGSMNMLGSATILLMAGTLLMTAVDNMNGAVVPLINASNSLIFAAISLSVAAGWLLPSAIAIFVGMSWLELATSRFKRSVDDIERIANGMLSFANAFQVISRAPTNAIADAVKTGLDAIPGINKLATELDRSAALFSKAADKFTEPVDRISNSLNMLGVALSEVGAKGLNFQADMDRIGAMLDKYSELFDGAAKRIEIAVSTKVQPAMAEARREGLEDIIKSEPITTVKVMNDSEGGADAIDNNVLLLQEQVQLLRNINQSLGIIAGGKGTELTEIIDLLEAHLPSVVPKTEGLSTEFNQWMK